MTNFSGSKNILELKNICQSYIGADKNPFLLFDSFNLEIEDVPDKGQFIALMGESGCGKSTLLRYITNLQKPDSGDVLLAGNLLTIKDTIPMVFQMPSSLEWYTVLQNVALPLILRGVPEKDAHEQAMAMIKVVDLVGHENKYAKYPLLSGGQLQRVAIARSLVANPKMIMMDEPFSALDTVNKKKMQVFLMNIFHNSEIADLNPTILLVTHDEHEAVFLANNVIVMGSNPGHIKCNLKLDLPKTEATRQSKEYLDTVAYLENL